MNIIIKATKLEISQDIKSYIEDKINSLSKYFKNDDPVEARVEVEKAIGGQRQGQIFRAEVNLRYDGKFIRVEKEEEDLLAAIDFIKDELKEKIHEEKDKDITLQRRGARAWKKFWAINPLARFNISRVWKSIRKK